jgi:hypothetical protein
VDILSSANGVFRSFSPFIKTYYIKGFNSSGCFNEDTIVIDIKPNILICNIFPISNGFKVSSSIPQSSIINYTWYLNGNPLPNSNNDSLHSTSYGIYSCEIEISFGCTKSSNFIYFLDINDIDIYLNEWMISPNPASKEIVISFNQNVTPSEVEVRIYDVMGKKIFSEKPKSSFSTTINTSQLQSGLYNVVLYSNGKLISSKKLIIEK